MNNKIRLATENDLSIVANIFDLYRQFYKQPSDINRATKFISERLNAKDSIILISENNTNEPTGFAQMFYTFSSVHTCNLLILNDLYVKNEFRKQGIATALLQACKEVAENHRSKSILLETESTNNSAKKLYEKFGYKLDNNITHYTLLIG